MKKVLTLIGAASLALLLNGCSNDSAGSADTHVKADNTCSSFQDKLNVDLTKLSWNEANSIGSRIVTDPETGVEYVELYADKGTSITPRLPKDGKPYINPKWKKH